MQILGDFNNMQLVPKPNSKKNNANLTIFDYNISSKELYDIFGVDTKQEYQELRKNEGNTLKDLILYLFLKYDEDIVKDFINNSFDTKILKQLSL